LVFEPQLLAEAAEQAVVPLLGREVLADGGEIEHGDAGAAVAEALGRADHEGRLAHLAGGEDVAELAAGQAVVQLAVGAAFEVARRVAAERAAGDVECVGRSGHGGSRVRVAGRMTPASNYGVSKCGRGWSLRKPRLTCRFKCLRRRFFPSESN